MSTKDYFKWDKLSFINGLMLLIMSITLVVIICMMVKYFQTFDEGFSTEHTRWGEFGNFFGSITGLLAFLGVLYTARQSEIRANKANTRAESAEIQILKNDQRGLFFQMISLYQKQVQTINVDNNLFNQLYDEIQYDLSILIILIWKRKRILKNRDLKINKDEDFEHIGEYFEKNYVYWLYENHNEKTELDYLKYYFKYGDFREYSENRESVIIYGKYFKENLTPNDRYEAISRVSEVIYKKYESILDTYFKTVSYIINISTNSIEKEDYFTILSSLISRKETLVLLVLCTNKYSKIETLINFYKSNLFNNIQIEDVLFVKKSKKDLYHYKILLKDFFRETLDLLIKEENR